MAIAFTRQHHFANYLHFILNKQPFYANISYFPGMHTKRNGPAGWFPPIRFFMEMPSER